MLEPSQGQVCFGPQATSLQAGRRAEGQFFSWLELARFLLQPDTAFAVILLLAWVILVLNATPSFWVLVFYVWWGSHIRDRFIYSLEPVGFLSAFLLISYSTESEWGSSTAYILIIQLPFLSSSSLTRPFISYCNPIFFVLFSVVSQIDPSKLLKATLSE